MTILTIKKSGYLASAAAVTWASGTTLTSLADNGFTSLSDEIDNSTTKYMLADLYIELGSAVFTGVDSSIDVFVVPSVDGTNYPSWATGTAEETENLCHLVGSGPTTASTAAQKIVITNIPLPTGKFKFAFRNRGNVSLASSANTVYWRPHSIISTDA